MQMFRFVRVPQLHLKPLGFWSIPWVLEGAEALSSFQGGACHLALKQLLMNAVDWEQRDSGASHCLYPGE